MDYDHETREIGWIKLWRKIMSNWVWEDKPFARGQAWIDMLLLTNHKDAKRLVGAATIQVTRGQLLTNQTELANRWGWSRTKVRRFLEELETDNMIKVGK